MQINFRYQLYKGEHVIDNCCYIVILEKLFSVILGRLLMAAHEYYYITLHFETDSHYFVQFYATCSIFLQTYILSISIFSAISQSKIIILSCNAICDEPML